MLLAVLFSSAACGPRPCLPGIDGVGIGFDAVTGTSFGVGRRVVRFNFTLGNTYTDPFGNRTVYGVPDHASVTTGSTQFMGHSVARSVSQYVSTQSEWAGVDTHFGPWFSASAETKETASQMSDNLHIVIESRSKVTLYAATLDPPMLLSPDAQFQAVIDSLPTAYDPVAYGRVVQYYGTHYVAVAEFGGLSRMRTVATQSYYSTTSDSELQAQASIQWGLFGGGGGGGSSRKDTSQEWKDGTQSSTYTQGGDPAIRSFESTDEWTRWAKSVETSAPVQTQYRLEELASMVKDAGKAANVRKAVFDYAVAHNATWPAADLVNYQMGWCDCYATCDGVGGDGQGACPAAPWIHGACQTIGCSKEGYVVVGQAHGAPSGRAEMAFYCCRPCFKASSSSSVTTKI